MSDSRRPEDPRLPEDERADVPDDLVARQVGEDPVGDEPDEDEDSDTIDVEDLP
ncbi:hypothetical protein [Microbacterium resistens]|uniref:hypothetical protein n=1 Tax=Microbacterium resistens TaxID=156977 RepID=UPI000A945839|nr:hypothetical protein [Microbacterium resistens]